MGSRTGSIFDEKLNQFRKCRLGPQLSRLETKHEIDERKANHIAAGDVEQRQIRCQLLPHEAKPERVKKIVVGDREQIVLRDETDPLRQSQLPSQHSYRFAFDLAAGESVAAAERDAGVP